MNENIINIINNDTIVLDYDSENINIDNYISIANDLCNNLIYNQINNNYILDTSLSQLKNLVDTLVYNVNYVFDTSFLTLNAQIDNMNEIGRNVSEELSILTNLNIENDFIRESSFNLLKENIDNSINNIKLDIVSLSRYIESIIDNSINNLKLNITNIIDNSLNNIQYSINSLLNKNSIIDNCLNYLENYLNELLLNEFASDISLIELSERVDIFDTTSSFILNNNFLTQDIFTISFNDLTNTINNDIQNTIGNLFVNLNEDLTNDISNLEFKIDNSFNIINIIVDDLKNYDIILDSCINTLELNIDNLENDISDIITTNLNTETSIINLQSDITNLTISGDYVFKNFVTRTEFTISFEEIKNNATIFNNIFNIIRNINYVKFNNSLLINSYEETIIDDFSLNITLQRENTNILTKLNISYLVSCVPDCMLEIKIYYKINNTHNLISRNILGTENTSFLYNNLYTTDITNLTNEIGDMYNFYITTKIFSIGDNIHHEILNNDENIPRILNNGNNIFIIEEI